MEYVTRATPRGGRRDAKRYNSIPQSEKQLTLAKIIKSISAVAAECRAVNSLLNTHLHLLARTLEASVIAETILPFKTVSSTSRALLFTNYITAQLK